LSRSIFNRKGIESMVVSHNKGKKNYTEEISWALTIELIFQQLIDDL